MCLIFLFGLYLEIYYNFFKPKLLSAVSVFLKNKEILYFGCLNMLVTVIWIILPVQLLFKFILLALVAMCNLLLINKSNVNLLKICGLFWSFVIFNSFLFIIYFIQHVSVVYKFVDNIYMLRHNITFNTTSLLYGLDVISVLFILLTTFLFIIVFLNGLTLEMKELKSFYVCIYIIFFFLLNIFLVQNLFLFFFFF